MRTKRFSITHYFFALLLLITVYGCGKPDVDHWSEFVPGSTPFVLVPEQGTTLSEALSAPYMPLFDDISPSAIQLVNNIVMNEDEEPDLPIEAILLYSDTSNDWQPVWIGASKEGLIDYLTSKYQREFEQNRYRFHSFTIEKLFFSERVLFITEVGNYTIFSESSLGIENILRTISGNANAIQMTADEFTPGSLIVNTGNLERWVHQLVQVSYRPMLLNIFDGSTPTSFTLNNSDNGEYDWQLTGNMELRENRSALINSISAEPSGFSLERFIPVNAAAFSIFRLPARPDFSKETSFNTDEYLMENQNIAHLIGESLFDEVAFAAFAESGAESTSEYVFLRAINDSTIIKEQLDILADNDFAIKDGDTYSLQSNILGSFFGSSINPMSDFYITVYDEFAVLAQRKGLAESIGGDADRRRVMYYDDDYMNIKDSLPAQLSSIHYIDAPRFGTYIQPWLYPQNYMGALLSNLDQFVITTVAEPGQSSVDISMTSFQREALDRPYREQWAFPLGGAELTAEPILADITRSGRDEVLFSTDNGYVYVLATDGTVVLQLPTNGDEPLGSPVAYDWYGNNQKVIMQAAGDKIYAWNNSGELLPNFPFIMDETITTPITVMDITRNGIAEVILSTADRNTYILNSRGESINGWPRNTNASVDSKPLVAEIDGQRSMFAFAENALHAWNINGQTREGFPLFLDTQMHGSPVDYENHLLGAGRDGNLYAIGTNPLFSGEFSETRQNDSLMVQTISASNSSLNSTPRVYNILQRDEDGTFFSENLILTQSSGGSLFLHNSEAELRFTHSLGQPASNQFNPLIVDLDNNQRDDLVALADFGRLYAWDLLSGGRLHDLPTSGMKFLIIKDLLGNGQKELIAQTRDGLQTWTIYRTRREAPGS